VKKFIAVVTAIAAFGFVNTASAADMPTKAPAPMMVPMYNWAGWYVGGNVGYGWGANSNPGLTFADPGPVVGFAGYFAAGGNVTPNVQPKGVIGGLQLGYNLQSNNFVYGLVTDIQASGMKASATNTVTPPGFVLSNQMNSVEIDWFGTLRAKLGLAQNNWLFYATGGLAYGQVKTSGSFFAPPGVVSFAGSNSTTRAGWAAGAGLDYGLTPNWTIGVEYLYIDLGHVSYTETQATFPAASLTVSNHAAANIARATLNYKF
jgi:outer membrane immunogenic protein